MNDRPVGRLSNFYLAVGTEGRRKVLFTQFRNYHTKKKYINIVKHLRNKVSTLMRQSKDVFKELCPNSHTPIPVSSVRCECGLNKLTGVFIRLNNCVLSIIIVNLWSLRHLIYICILYKTLQWHVLNAFQFFIAPENIHNFVDLKKL